MTKPTNQTVNPLLCCFQFFFSPTFPPGPLTSAARKTCTVEACVLQNLTRDEKKTFALSKKHFAKGAFLRKTRRRQSVFADRRTTSTALRSVKSHASPSGALIGINAAHGDGHPPLSSWSDDSVAWRFLFPPSLPTRSTFQTWPRSRLWQILDPLLTSGGESESNQRQTECGFSGTSGFSRTELRCLSFQTHFDRWNIQLRVGSYNQPIT